MSRSMDAWGHAITPMLRALKDLDVPLHLIEYAQLLDVFVHSHLLPKWIFRR
jgi:hypothetical protein